VTLCNAEILQAAAIKVAVTAHEIVSASSGYNSRDVENKPDSGPDFICLLNR
jgi:hypothetical protein